MNSEYVTYKGILHDNPTSNIAKTLELQQWILDPSSRPYNSKDTRLIARSAGTAEVKSKSTFTVEQQLELQSRIISS